MSCVHYGANNKSRSKDLSGLASTSVHQLLASSCLGRPAQMSGVPSTSSLEVLKGQCVQGAVLKENFNHPHTNIDHKAQVRHMHSHSGTVGAHQHLNAPAKKCQYACEIISHSQTRSRNQPSPSPCPPCRHHLPFWQSRPCLASCTLILARHTSDAATQLRESVSVNNLWLD